MRGSKSARRNCACTPVALIGTSIFSTTVWPVSVRKMEKSILTPAATSMVPLSNVLQYQSPIVYESLASTRKPAQRSLLRYMLWRGYIRKSSNSLSEIFGSTMRPPGSMIGSLYLEVRSRLRWAKNLYNVEVVSSNKWLDQES